MPKLTTYKADNLRPRDSQYEVFDQGRPLALRVGKTGVKSWVLFYRAGGRQRRLTLGRYPAMSIADARLQCEQHLETLAKGIDPADQLHGERTLRQQAPTFAILSAEYIERYAKRYKRSWKTDQAYIDRFLLPAFGTLKAGDLSRRQVIALTEEIAEDTPVQARRVFALLRSIYNWGIRVDLAETSPCDRVRPPGQEQPRDRVLTAAEIRILWSVLDGVRPAGSSRSKEHPPMSEGTALAIKLALVTGQRIGEVTGMTWFEVDRDAAWWTIPATRSKNGLEHRVPLSRLALEILVRAAAIAPNSGYTFPGRTPTQHIDHGVIGHALRRTREKTGLPPFTAHDLRRTAATRMASTGVSRVVIGKLLNHVERGVTAIYDRAGYDQEKREALDAWEAELRQIVGLEAAEGGQR